MAVINGDRNWLRFADSDGLEIGFLFSSLFHISVIAFSLVTFPMLKNDLPPPPAPMIVDIVPISDITNLPPMPSKALPKVEEKPIERKIEQIEQKPLPAPPAPTEKKAVPLPEQKPLPEKKPVEPKPTEDKKTKQPEPDFESVLKTVEKFKQQPAADPAPAPQTETKSHVENQPFIESMPISVSEMDAVRRQIEACWNLPAGARNPEDLIVQVWVSLNPDGTLQQAKVIDDKGRANYDPFYRAAAESAIRALLNPRCTPLKLPPDKYYQWKTMTINFDPRQMLGYR